MTPRSRVSSLLTATGFWILFCPFLLAQTDPPLCPKVVDSAVMENAYRQAVELAPRVEVRQCDPGGTETLQIVALESAGRVLLKIEDGDVGVRQVYVQRNIFLIETLGGMRNRVYVLDVGPGKAKILLRRVTKGRTEISVREDEIVVVVKGIWAGSAGTRDERHVFPVGK